MTGGPIFGQEVRPAVYYLLGRTLVAVVVVVLILTTVTGLRCAATVNDSQTFLSLPPSHYGDVLSVTSGVR